MTRLLHKTLDKNTLIDKIKYFIKRYNKSVKEKNLDESIKWSRDLRNKFKREILVEFSEELLTKAQYRPFYKVFFYADTVINDVLTSNHASFHGDNFQFENKVISVTGIGSTSDFSVFSFNQLVDRNFYHHIPQCLSLYTLNNEGERVSNITEYGLNEFREEYNEDVLAKDIFHYTYGVLHSPSYSKKYEQDLKREFPRIPFYEDFWQWAEWGEQLMDFHINYEEAEPFGLKIEKANVSSKPKSKLKADKENSTIQLDENTSVHGIPEIAWEYKLGNRSALEWILDQYKEKKPRDKTIREKFNTYKFADYKDEVIELLQKVTTVSVKTMEIVREMEKVDIE